MLPHRTHPAPPLAAVSAQSPDSATVLASYFDIPVDEITVTGTSALDHLPEWKPLARRIAVLSTSDMAARDPQLTLVRLTRILVERGDDVRIRLHPREDPGPWQGLPVVTGESPVTTAATARVAVGYPGTAHTLYAAVGCCTIALAPTVELADVHSPTQKLAWSANTRGINDTLAAIDAGVAPNRQHLAAVTGPIGGAASRITRHWHQPLT